MLSTDGPPSRSPYTSSGSERPAHLPGPEPIAQFGDWTRC